MCCCDHVKCSSELAKDDVQLLQLSIVNSDFINFDTYSVAYFYRKFKSAQIMHTL